MEVCLMRVLMCGDVMGKAGRKAIEKYVPRLRKELNLDLVIANGENAAHGFGINEKNCQELYAAGVNVITTGNHIWDQREIVSYIRQDPYLLRPINLAEGSPGKGFVVYKLKDGRKALIINAQGNLFLPASDMPFPQIEKVVKAHLLGQEVQGIFVDFHGEANSEKNALGYYLDGQVTAVVGTHCHIPTADTRILHKGTAYQTDLGMTGSYDSVIGMDSDIAIQRILGRGPAPRLSPVEKEGTLSGLFIDSDDSTGLAKEVKRIIIGPILENSL